MALVAVACALLALVAFQLYSASRPAAAPIQTVATTPAASGDSSDGGYVTQNRGHGNLP